MRQVPRSPLSFKLQRVANVPEHPPPSTRLMSCAHIANRRLSRIIGVRCLKAPACPGLSLSLSLHRQRLSLRARDKSANLSAPTDRCKRSAETCHNAPSGARHDRSDTYQKTERLAAWFGVPTPHQAAEDICAFELL